MSKKYIQIIVATRTEWTITKSIIDKFYSYNHCAGLNDYTIEFNSCFVKISYLDSIGNVHSAIKTYELIKLDNPLFILVAGICAGKKGENRKYGDIILGTEVLYYEPEKINPEDSEWRVQFYYSDFPVELIKMIKIENDDLSMYLPKGITNINSNIHNNGVYASGEKVINSIETLNLISSKALSSIKKDFTALDMETAGIAMSCYMTNTNFVFMKAISDFGVEKTDLWQNYAAANSIYSAIKFCELLTSIDLNKYKIFPLERGDNKKDRYEIINDFVKLSSKFLIYNGLNGGFTNKIQNIHEYVTDQDNEIENYLIDKFKLLFGTSHKFYAEESHFMDITAGEAYWIIDPIDGTLNYKDGRIEYCISVAEYKNGEITFGSIYFPVRRLLISVKKQGLYVNNVLRENVRKIPSNTDDMVIALPGDLKKLENTPTAINIKKIIDNFGIIRITGALAYDLGCLALGEIDGRISLSVKPEDAAAGVYLIRKTGGYVTDIGGSEWNINSTTLIAARNHDIHMKLLNILKQSINLN
jgi:myo-inositol-1(or 4)-monophosphatase